MTLNRITLGALILAVLGGPASRPAGAVPQFWKQFQQKYIEGNENEAFAATLTATKCNVCHVKDQDKKKVRNRYGQALSKLITKDDKKNVEKIKGALDSVAKNRSVEGDAKSPTFGDLLAAAKLPGGGAPAVAGTTAAKPAVDPEVLKPVPFKPSADARQAIARIEEIGGTVRVVAANDDSLEVDFHLGGKRLTDDGLQHLKQLKKVVYLHLKETQITDAGLAHLADLQDLRTLHLEKTKITDAGLEHVATLPALEYLNLYGTEVSDGGLARLHGLKKLKRLYVWQSRAGEEGIEKIKAALPELRVVPDPRAERELAALNARRAEEARKAAEAAAAKAAAEKAAAEKEKGAAGKDGPGPPLAKTLAKGNFVRVRLEGKNRVLSLAEVEVLEKGSGKPLHPAGAASQSSTGWSGDAARGNDANTNHSYFDKSVTHTEIEDNPWWLLDLKGEKEIGRIVAHNRGDCCGDRLAGAIVEVLGPDQKPVWSGTVEGATDGSKHVFEGK